MKLLIQILIAIIVIGMILILLGIYRFNFTDDDLYIEVNGTIVPYGNH